MRITKKQFKKIIKEEIEGYALEQSIRTFFGRLKTKSPTEEEQRGLSQLFQAMYDYKTHILANEEDPEEALASKFGSDKLQKWNSLSQRFFRVDFPKFVKKYNNRMIFKLFKNDRRLAQDIVSKINTAQVTASSAQKMHDAGKSVLEGKSVSDWSESRAKDTWGSLKQKTGGDWDAMAKEVKSWGISDPDAFLATLEKKATGKWPAED